MNLVLTGSRAIQYHFPIFTREPKDYDIYGTQQDFDELI
jgi:hypothetical protein